MDIREKEIVNANIIRVAVGTNGFKGGDTGHGSRTVFEIEDLASTDMQVDVEKDGALVRLRFGGDTELETFIEALEFALETLKEQSKRL